MKKLALVCCLLITMTEIRPFSGIEFLLGVALVAVLKSPRVQGYMLAKLSTTPVGQVIQLQGKALLREQAKRQFVGVQARLKAMVPLAIASRVWQPIDLQQVQDPQKTSTTFNSRVNIATFVSPARASRIRLKDNDQRAAEEQNAENLNDKKEDEVTVQNNYTQNTLHNHKAPWVQYVSTGIDPTKSKEFTDAKVLAASAQEHAQKQRWQGRSEGLFLGGGLMAWLFLRYQDSKKNAESGRSYEGQIIDWDRKLQPFR